MTAQEIYCLQLLRRRAYALYFSILFAPAAKRGALAALYAFRLEILHIAEQAQEPLLGEMRLQWWRDSLIEAVKNTAQSADNYRENIKEQKTPYLSPAGAAASPVIAAAAAAIKLYNLPLAAFLRLCDAAHCNLYNNIMSNRAALEDYCRELYSTVLRLAGRILAKDEADWGSKAEDFGGIAQGFAALVSRLPQAVRQEKLYIPADILASLGIDRQSLYKPAGKADAAADTAGQNQIMVEKRKTALAALLACFHETYAAFRAEQKKLPALMRPAFLPLAVLPAFMRQAEKQQEAVFTEALTFAPLRQQAAICRAAFFNRF